MFMMFNATFNNISAISWRSVLLVTEIGIPRDNLIAQLVVNPTIMPSRPQHQLISTVDKKAALTVMCYGRNIGTMADNR
jgi:hypothetical protein